MWLRGTRRALALSLVALTIGVLAAAPAAGLRPMHLLRGLDDTARFGEAIDGIGDVDGDGSSDFIVGEPLSDSATGRALVYSGRRASVLYELVGSRAGIRFGYSAAGLGDVNGDGVPDFAVGAPLEGPGVVRVYSGIDASVLLELEGRDPEAKFGAAVSRAGDVNGDRLEDLVVTAPGAGRVTVVSGANGRILREHDGFQGLKGETRGGGRIFNGDGVGDIRLEARSAGDVDRDGFVDLLVGDTWAKFARGRVLVFSGRDGSTLLDWTGARNGSSYFGFSVDGIADLDGDGRREILIGASGTFRGPYYGGEVQIRSGRDGRLIRHHLAPDTGHHYMGRAVRAVGDVDRDGVEDYLVGLPYRGPSISFQRGSVWLYSGRTGDVLAEVDGPKRKKRVGRRPQFGYYVNVVGDVDGDGVIDFGISSPFEKDGRGAVRIYSGRKLLAGGR